MTSLGGIVNIFSEIKKYEEDTLFAGKAVEQMTKAFGNMNVDDAIKAFRGLGIEGEDLVEILLDCGVKSEVVEASIKKVGKTGAPIVTKLKDGFKGLASTLGLTTKQLVAFGVAGLAIGAITAAVKAYNSWLQKCVDNAKAATETWSAQNDKLEDQVSRIDELNKKLKEGNLTEQEAYDVKSELYSIQSSLVETYGDQAEGIDLVNGKLDAEIQKVKDLTAAWAEEIVTEQGVGGRHAVRQMNKDQNLYLGEYNLYTPDNDGTDVIKSLVDKYPDFIKPIFNGDGITQTIRFKGDAEDAKRVIGEMMKYVRDSGYDLDETPILDSFYNSLESGYQEVKGVVDEYKDLADSFTKAMIIDDNSMYTVGSQSLKAYDWMEKYTTSIENYNKALADGDQVKINAAAKEFAHMQSVMTEFANGEMVGYADYIYDIESGLNVAAIAANNFKQAISGNDDVLGRSIDEYGKQLKSMNLDDIDLKSMLKNSNDAEFGEYQFRKILEAAKECGFIVGESEEEIQRVIDVLITLGYISGEVSGSLDNATNSYTTMIDKLSGVKSEFDAVNNAIKEQGYNGNLSVDTYNSLIAISSDYSACIEYQNGALQLNAEKANLLLEAKAELQKQEVELQKITESIEWEENAKKIDEYRAANRELKLEELEEIEALEKRNSTIEANLVGYDLQIAAIEELTSAYGRWKAVSESDNSDSMYKDLQKAYEQIKEAQKTGQTGVGNVVYQAAVELLVPEGEDVKKYMSTLQKYIMDGSNGLSNFINDMVTNELMDRSGSEVKMKMGVTMEQICNTMKITPDMAKAIFNALEMYDFDFHWTDEDFNINTDKAMTDLKAAQEEMNKTIAKINEMKAAGKTVDLVTGISLGDYEKQYAEQKKTVDKLMGSVVGETQDNTVEYTVTANTEAAEDALSAIKESLDEISGKLSDLAKKVIGTFGAYTTLGVLTLVYDRLRDINNLKIADKYFTVYEVTEKIDGFASTTHTSSSGTTHGGGGGSFGSNATGTRKADGGISLVGDEYSSDGSPKPELIISDGYAYLAGQNGPELVNLNEGDQVVPASETEEILSKNPDARKLLVPAFATGAGGYAAGSAAEQMYLDGRISATQEYIKQQEQKAKDDALIKELSQKAAEKSADDTYLNTNAAKNTGSSTKTYLTTVSDGGDTGSLKNGGSGGSGGSSSSGSSGSSSSTKEKSAFEKEYESRNHLLAMEKLSYEDYIDWLEDAYKEAYNKGQIELEDFYRYEEEVFNGQKELFQDSIGDIEHKIKELQREPGNEKQIIAYYKQIISDIDKEIAEARARGLNDDDDYIQELLEQKWDYADEIKDIEEEITENAKDAVDELIEYRIDMLKQDLENEKDAVNDKLDTLRDFYDKQKEMLQDVYDEEKYLEEQSEKRKAKSDIEAEIEMLKFDDSAWADKRRKELEEELKAAEKELADFEKDHALESATDLLDKMYEQQEAQIQTEIDAIDARLNDPDALFNQALRDIQNNTLALYEEMVEYNNKYGSGNDNDIYDMWMSADDALDAFLKSMGYSYNNIAMVDAYKPTGYANGTSNATPGIHELFEGNKDEYVLETSDGRRYKMFSGLGQKVLNASATDFLYKFANNGEAFMSSMINGLIGNIGSVGRQMQQISLSTGNVIVQGNATADTVSAIRRAQRENIDYVLREFTRLNR